MPLDAASVRQTNPVDGHLHVRVSNISKSMVCPYRGNEIPKFDELGLEPSRVYYLLRDPEELRRAIPTFNNLQVLDKHVYVNADDPNMSRTVGSTGTDAAWRDPYVTNSLVFWDAKAIAKVESEAQRELSASYHYDADMTPGTYKETRYDGVMRNIRGNHVAIVESGRAGSDVVVMDAAFSPEDEAAYDAEFNESSVKRGEGGKFATNAVGASEGMAHHAAKASEARKAGKSDIARPHERAARAYGAAAEHYDAKNDEAGHAAHKEAGGHGRVAASREAKGAAPAPATPPVTPAPAAPPVTPAPAAPPVTPAPAASGKFGSGPKAKSGAPTALLPNGYIAAKYPNLGGDSTRYSLTHPNKSATHQITHDSSGKVTQHSVTTPHTTQTVKGPHHGTKTDFVKPEESEVKYKKLHESIRAADPKNSAKDSLETLDQTAIPNANAAVGKVIPATVDKDGTKTRVAKDSRISFAARDEKLQIARNQLKKDSRMKPAMDAFSESKIKRDQGGKFSGGSPGAFEPTPEGAAAGEAHHTAMAKKHADLHASGASVKTNRQSHKNAADTHQLTAEVFARAGKEFTNGGNGARAVTNANGNSKYSEKVSKMTGQHDPYAPGTHGPRSPSESVEQYKARTGAKDSKVAKDAQLEKQRMNAKAQRAALVKGIRAGALLAKDASIDNLAALLNALEPAQAAAVAPAVAAAAPAAPAAVPPAAPAVDPAAVAAPLGAPGGPEEAAAANPDDTGLGDPDGTNDPAEDDDIEGKVRELLTGKLDDADLEMLLKLIRPDGTPPADPEASSTPDDGGDPPDPADDDLPANLENKGMGPAMKPAMDAAIKAASAGLVAEAVTKVTAQINARAKAEREVRPWVGEIKVAMDSADEVYAFALEQMGVKTKGVHASAFPTLLGMIPKPGDAPRPGSRVAMDAAKVADFTKRFPGTDRIRKLG